MSEPFDMKRFTELVAAYGAGSELWPEAERPAALAFLESSSEARALSESERALDAALSGLSVPEPSAHLMRQLNEIPLHHPKPTQRTGRLFRLVTGFAWAAAAAIGVYLGVESSSLETGIADADGAGQVTPESLAEDEIETIELALGSVAGLGEEP
jgi:hypothetical protein